MSAAFKDMSEVRDFLAWCKSQGVQHVEVDGVRASFSHLAIAQVVSALRKPDPGPASPDAREEDDEIDPATGYRKEDLFASSE